MLRTNPFRAVGVMSLEKQGTAGPIRSVRHRAVYGAAPESQYEVDL
jgi:hypothetical protein